MKFKPEIRELIQTAFGIDTFNVDGYKGVSILESPVKTDRLSKFGTPVLHTLTFKGKSYRYYNNDGTIAQKTLNDFQFPAVCLSSFSRKKKMSETELTGGYGTVDEIFGFESWKITIRGLCIADSSHPQAKNILEQRKKILEFENIIEQIGVVSSLYNDTGIDAIVIKEIKTDQLEGNPDVIPFRIEAKSVTPKDLLL